MQWWGWVLIGGAAGTAIGLFGLLFALLVYGRKLKALGLLSGAGREERSP